MLFENWNFTLTFLLTSCMTWKKIAWTRSTIGETASESSSTNWYHFSNYMRYHFSFYMRGRWCLSIKKSGFIGPFIRLRPWDMTLLCKQYEKLIREYYDILPQRVLVYGKEVNGEQIIIKPNGRRVIPYLWQSSSHVSLVHTYDNLFSIYLPSKYNLVCH